MSKYLRRYEIYKEKNLEKTKQRVIMKITRIVWVFDATQLTFLDYIDAHKTGKHIKKYMGHFDPLRRSRRFKFSAVLALT